MNNRELADVFTLIVDISEIKYARGLIIANLIDSGPKRTQEDTDSVPQIPR